MAAARRPATDAQFTMAPPPDATIAGSSWRMHEKVPVRSTASTRFQFSMVASAVGLPCSPSIPAALNAASSRPKVATAWAMASRTLSSSVTSQRTNEHVPSGSSSACAAFPASPFTSASTVAYPRRTKAAAAARPIPDPAPVTKATFGPARSFTSVPPGCLEVG